MSRPGSDSEGELRRQLVYKTAWYGSQLVVAGRWYPSSKPCSACGAVKAKLALADRTYHCDHCGAVLDRDLNAAINLARLSEHATRVEGRPAGSGPVAGRGAIRKTSPPTGAAAGGNETSTPAQRPPSRWSDGDRPSARRSCLTMRPKLIDQVTVEQGAGGRR
jgi:putative transposase